MDRGVFLLADQPIRPWVMRKIAAVTVMTDSSVRFEEEPSIDSLVCATDTMAVGAMTYLKEIGLRIPEDVQIAGIGDGVPGKIVEPKLTTVHFYYKTSGMEAAAMLADLIENDTGISKEIKMGCELVERESHR